MTSADPPANGVRRVQRSLSDRWIGGVAGGLAEHFGVPAWIIRVAFVVTTLSGGLGLVAYALMWMLFPLSNGEQGAVARRPDGGWDLAAILGTLAVALGLLVGLALIGLPIRVSAWAPVLVVGAGAILLWRQGDDLRGASLRSRAGDGVQGSIGLTDRQGWVRVLVGLGLVAVGLLAVIGPRLDLVTTGWALVAVAAVVVGMGLIALPWISSWLRGLEAQRYAAVRAEERAAMAARVHDSVLQTLTLIQRRADDPSEVARLARAEERALRSWLYAPVGPAGSLGAALAQVVASTETDYDARIELVTVGDAPLDAGLDVLVAATREAVVNAAKHAQAPVTVYAEVDDEQVEINVRDRGLGFELADVPADRHGIRSSIQARMTAVHGAAALRSAPGEGTEVRLILPRAPAAPDPRGTGPGREGATPADQGAVRHAADTGTTGKPAEDPLVAGEPVAGQRPVEAQPADVHRADVHRADVRHVGAKGVGSQVSDPHPADPHPADPHPADPHPADAQHVGAKEVDGRQAVDHQVSDHEVAGAEVVDRQGAGPQGADCQVAGTEVVDHG